MHFLNYFFFKCSPNNHLQHNWLSQNSHLPTYDPFSWSTSHILICFVQFSRLPFDLTVHSRMCVCVRVRLPNKLLYTLLFNNPWVPFQLFRPVHTCIFWHAVTTCVTVPRQTTCRQTTLNAYGLPVRHFFKRVFSRLWKIWSLLISETERTSIFSQTKKPSKKCAVLVDRSWSAQFAWSLISIDRAQLWPWVKLRKCAQAFISAWWLQRASECPVPIYDTDNALKKLWPQLIVSYIPALFWFH